MQNERIPTVVDYAAILRQQDWVINVNYYSRPGPRIASLETLP